MSETAIGESVDERTSNPYGEQVVDECADDSADGCEHHNEDDV